MGINDIPYLDYNSYIQGVCMNYNLEQLRQTHNIFITFNHLFYYQIYKKILLQPELQSATINYDHCI